MAQVKFFGNLRDLAQAKSLEVPGETVRTVLDAACQDNLPLYNAIMENGTLRPHIRIIIGGRDIELSQGLDTPIKPGEQLAIFPAIAGG